MNKDKLINLLKTNKEVKNAMEKLEFGCKVNFKFNIDSWYSEWVYLWKNRKISTEPDLFRYNSNWNVVWFDINNLKYGQQFQIIWLPLQERFIRMYTRNNIKKYPMAFFIEDSWEIWYWHNSTLIVIDNTKDFDNQSQEVYWKIYKALKLLDK